MSNFRITPKKLNFNDIEQIIDEGIHLELSEESSHLIDKSRAYLENKIKIGDGPLYGINTGFGALCDVSISRDQLETLQENLVKSHACGTGEIISGEIVKRMLLFKIHALSYGKSGIRKETVQHLIHFFNKDILPVVYSQGSLGASGDLAPLAHMVLPLIGAGEVFYKGKKMPSIDALRQENLKLVKLGAKEGLALLNGTQFMSAHGAYIISKGEKLLKAADAIAALSLDAYDGCQHPFYDILHQVRPHRGQILTAKSIRNILEGSQLISRTKNHVQDPYSFRCIPQVHGASKDAFRHIKEVLLTEINSVTDNPTIFPVDDLIISGGNFHGQPMAIGFDYLAIALAELGNISERRVYRLISGQRGLPEFLVAKQGLNSGFMIPQYAAASIVSQNKQLCTPASVDSIPSSNEQEDHVSMGANAATKLKNVADNLEQILAIELLTASQALAFRHPEKTSPYLEKLYEDFRKEVPFIEKDDVLHDYIMKTVKFLRKYSF